MANLTLSIEEGILKKARLRALEQGTSVNAVVRDHLQKFALGVDDAEDIIARINEIAERSQANSGGKKWTRESLHDRESFRRK